MFSKYSSSEAVTNESAVPENINTIRLTEIPRER